MRRDHHEHRDDDDHDEHGLGTRLPEYLGVLPEYSNNHLRPQGVRAVASRNKLKLHLGAGYRPSETCTTLSGPNQFLKGMGHAFRHPASQVSWHVQSARTACQDDGAPAGGSVQRTAGVSENKSPANAGPGVSAARIRQDIDEYKKNSRDARSGLLP